MTLNSALAGERVALVIGNSDYGKSTGSLKNPVNDAADIAKKLALAGFKVTKLLNASRGQMKQAIRTFSRELGTRGTVGLFYFAGHGVQVEGENFLIPVGADIQSEFEVADEAISAGRILRGMRQAGNGLNLVILDACRNNPYARSFRSAERGLARMDAPNGSMIIYATSPGDVAQDGSGRNGVFTKNLLQNIDKPGLTVDQVFKNTTEAVFHETSKQQRPYREGSIIGEFYFNATTPNKVANVTVKQPAVNTTDIEDRFIDVMDQSDLAQIKLYLEQYPKGKLSALFRLKLKSREITESRLTIRSNVNGDRVSIDGKDYGSTRVEVLLKHGEHRIEISKKGYVSYKDTIQLTANHTIRGVLKKSVPVKAVSKKQSYKKFEDFFAKKPPVVVQPVASNKGKSSLVGKWPKACLDKVAILAAEYEKAAASVKEEELVACEDDNFYRAEIDSCIYEVEAENYIKEYGVGLYPTPELHCSKE